MKKERNASIELSETPRVPGSEEVDAFQEALKDDFRRLAATNDIILRMDPELNRLERAAQKQLVEERKRWNRITDVAPATATSTARVAIEADCFSRDGLSPSNCFARVYRYLLSEEFQKAFDCRDSNRIFSQIVTEMGFAIGIEKTKRSIKQVLNCMWEYMET